MASSALAAWMTSKPPFSIVSGNPAAARIRLLRSRSPVLNASLQSSAHAKRAADVLFRFLWFCKGFGLPALGPARGGYRTRQAADTGDASLGCLFQQTFLTGVLEFLGYHLESDQSGGTEGR